MLTAKTAVNNLLVEPEYTSLKDGVNVEEVSTAYSLVDLIVEGELKV